MPVNLPKAASGQQAPAESAAVTIGRGLGDVFEEFELKVVLVID